MLVFFLLLLQGAHFAGSHPGAPQNITIIFRDPRTVRVLWSSVGRVDKFDVTYKPSDANFRIVTVVAGNSESVTLHSLEPETQYQVTVTAVRGGVKARSRPVVFRTLTPLTESPHAAESVTPNIDELNPDPTAVGSRFTPITSVNVRGVEISLVLLALVVWIFAITLFFHRWGKIRMLLPYQPDYKTQQTLKVPGTGSTTCQVDGSGHPDGTGCVQHLRWSSRFLDEPTRPASGWSSRHRLSCANFSGYVLTSTECESPERLRHARSHSSLQPITIPVPLLPRQRGSIHSLLDCLKSTRQELPEAQPLFVVPDPVAVEETPLNGSPPPRRYNRNSLKKQKTTTDEEMRLKHLTPAEIKRKTFLRKISLQDTHLNYNQDYWLEYDKSTRYHTSLDLGYFTPESEQGPDKPTDKQGPSSSLGNQAINESKKRQSDLPTSNVNTDLFSSENFDYYKLRKKCSCNGCGTKSSLNGSRVSGKSIRTPSSENLPLFLERVGHIETDFDGLEEPRSESAFSDITLNGTTFDFDGGDAFFGEARSSTSGESGVLGSDYSPQCEPAFSVPVVSVSRPSNSPSPIG